MAGSMRVLGRVGEVAGWATAAAPAAAGAFAASAGCGTPSTAAVVGRADGKVAGARGGGRARGGVVLSGAARG